MGKTKASLNILNMYELLTSGQRIRKNELAEKYGVDQRTVQRYIADLRAYFAEEHRYEFDTEIVYDRADNSYKLSYINKNKLYVQDILAVCKILLDSRAFVKEEMDQLIEKLLAHAAEKDKRLVKGIILNEKFHYIEPRHKKKLLKTITELSKNIASRDIIKISYSRKDGVDREHTIKPLFITFSEYYFYLVAFMADGTKPLPTVFRVDRISNAETTGEHFTAFKNRVEEGEFKKRVQFMYSGELHRVKFLYKGENIDSVLDRLPTAQILDKSEEGYTVTAEVYGDGIYMWLRSQGDKVKSLSM
ncbi:MAG: WYL domain-containing protein [Clostridia bacterium]|nr:WYL domain-containing protein [Clostridia bacterium]